MKTHKLLAGIFLALLAHDLDAQQYASGKGATILSGMISFQSNGGDLYGSDRINFLQITPSFSSMVANNFALGGSLEFAGQWEGGASITSVAIGPHLGWIGGTEASTSFPYFIVGFRYISQSVDFGSPLFGSSTASGTNISVNGGTIVALRKHLGLNIGIRFDLVTLSQNSQSESGNIISIGAGLSGLLFKAGE